jgi:hypothetical protein
LLTENKIDGYLVPHTDAHDVIFRNIYLYLDILEEFMKNELKKKKLKLL